MSLSLDYTADQAASLKQYIKGYSSTTQIVLETNKRTIIQCKNRYTANNLRSSLLCNEYRCSQPRKGNQSTYWYVQVTF